MTPAVSSSRTRRRQGDGLSPTLSASSTLARRASSCSNARILRSMASSAVWRNFSLKIISPLQLLSEIPAYPWHLRNDVPRRRGLFLCHGPAAETAVLVRAGERAALRHAARAGAQGALALDLDDPSRQPHPREPRRAEGGRAPGELRLGGHAADRALLPCAQARRPRRGQAARGAGLPRHPVSARAAKPRGAREFPRLRRRAILSLAHQGQDRGGFLHRLGRPRRRHDSVRGPGAGLCAAAEPGAERPAARPHDRGDGRRRTRRRQRLRGTARRLQAGRAQPVVGDRLQPPEPRRRVQRPPVPEDPAILRHRGLESGDAQIRQVARGRLRRAGRRRAAWLDRRLPERSLCRTALPGRPGRPRGKTARALAPGTPAVVGAHDDGALHDLMTNLAGHDMGSLVEAFDAAAADETPHCFVAYTIKGWNLPLAGHKDNHSGLMNPAQVEAFKAAQRIPDGAEWSPTAGLDAAPEDLQRFLAGVPIAAERPGRSERQALLAMPAVSLRAAAAISTQEGFGKIMNEIGRAGGEFARRVVTSSPDVTVSTNLGGWVNQAGVFARAAKPDLFRER